MNYLEKPSLQWGKFLHLLKKARRLDEQINAHKLKD